MACLLFVDESGHDLKESPYAVLAGICVEDRDLWNLIDAIKKLELATFGLSYSLRKEEFKAKKFLKRKVIVHPYDPVLGYAASSSGAGVPLRCTVIAQGI
jgi:hypothetical protein